jgi:hypothetical protein
MPQIVGIINQNQAIAAEDFDPAFYLVGGNQIRPNLRDQGPLAHIHRIAVGDWPSISSFNGQTYPVTQNWLPSVLASRMAVNSTAYRGYGFNWRVNGAGLWELYGDVNGVQETWTIDIMFEQYQSTQVTRFGNFT